MATTKISANANPAEEAASNAQPKATGSIPVPTITAAEVVVPTVSVVDGAAVAAPLPGAEGTMLKKQELVERIVRASGAKKKDVKLIVEATLGVIGDALSAGEVLNLQPLGKLKVNRKRDEGNAEVLIVKLRRGGGKGAGNEGPDDNDTDDKNCRGG
jgi:Tfp pilus assembly protein FimV